MYYHLYFLLAWSIFLPLSCWAKPVPAKLQGTADGRRHDASHRCRLSGLYLSPDLSATHKSLARTERSGQHLPIIISVTEKDKTPHVSSYKMVFNCSILIIFMNMIVKVKSFNDVKIVAPAWPPTPPPGLGNVFLMSIQTDFVRKKSFPYHAIERRQSLFP